MDEIVKIINGHFFTIFQTYPPLDNATVININPDDPDLKPISELDTYKLLTKFLKKSLGPNDFPKRILQEFTIELALPFCDIINCALKTGIFPDAFKISEIIPIPKENPPGALKDLQPISKTPIGGKILEKIIISELESDYWSNEIGLATTTITIDYSKAFDLVEHTIIIDKSVEIGVRGKVINLII